MENGFMAYILIVIALFLFFGLVLLVLAYFLNLISEAFLLVASFIKLVKLFRPKKFLNSQ